MGRFGTLEELAGTVAYLASDDSGFVTGAALPLDGGITSAFTVPHAQLSPYFLLTSCVEQIPLCDSTGGMVMRSARLADAPALAALWYAAGLHFRAEFVEPELQLALARNPDLVIVANEPSGGLAASVFGTFDGRRGWLNRLATSPDRRGRGIATGLVRELEQRLRAKGCVKINLLIEPANAAVVPFYTRLGFQARSLIFMDKWIAAPSGPPASGPPSSGPPAPAGTEYAAAPPGITQALAEPLGLGAPAAPGVDPSAVVAASAWTDLKPALYPEPYVFVTVPAPPPDIEPFAVVREDEGLTLVLTQDQADRAGLGYDYRAARITLSIGSSLAAIGLTAEVSRVLAHAGISCNVIAGFRHDHLFVDVDRGAEAAALLRHL